MEDTGYQLGSYCNEVVDIKKEYMPEAEGEVILYMPSQNKDRGKREILLCRRKHDDCIQSRRTNALALDENDPVLPTKNLRVTNP